MIKYYLLLWEIICLYFVNSYMFYKSLYVSIKYTIWYTDVSNENFLLSAWTEFWKVYSIVAHEIIYFLGPLSVG